MGACHSVNVESPQPIEQPKYLEQSKQPECPVRSAEDELLDILQNATLNNTPEVTYEFKLAKVIDIQDGDTITIAAIQRGVLSRFRLRIFGIDTPELKGETKEVALRAKYYLSDLILGKIVEVNILNKEDPRIKRMDPFGRLLGEIYTRGEKRINIAEDLLQKGYAVPYFGGVKKQNIKTKIRSLTIDTNC